MPKMKTHKATAKRIRLTGSGKLVRKIAGASHLMAKKSRSRKRRLKGLAVIVRVDQNRLVSLLGVKQPKGKAAAAKQEGGNDKG